MAVALVGAGRMGGVHLRALAHTRVAELAAVVEPDAGARARACAQSGAPGHAGVEQLLAAGRAEGVVITAPTDRHRALVEQLSAAGLAVFCEKPMGLTAGDAGAAAAAAAAAGVPLQVGYYRRFVPELAALRASIAAGELGQLSMLTLHQWDQQPPGPGFAASSGGIVVDMGVHELDQLRWLTAQEPVAAAAVGDESAAAITVRMSGRTLGVITLGRRFPVADSCWTEVVGTDGYERRPFLWGADGGAVMEAAVAAELDAFARRIRGEAVEAPGGDDAVAALRAAELVNAALAAQPTT